MKNLVFVLPAVLLIAACETRQQSALTGAAVGAALGAEVSGDDDKVVGALVGGAAGAAAGNYIGRTNTPGRCVYQDVNGNRYVAACP